MNENQHTPLPPDDGQPVLSAQMRRDLEIHELQKAARHHVPGIQHAPELPPAPPRKALTLLGGFLGVLVLAGAATLASQVSHARELARNTEADAVPTVAVVNPAREAPDEELVLPASLQAYEESPIYARTSGYLLKWYRDIGSHVKKGELLAEIDTPEIDQELNQARATRQQVVAQADLARISADRWGKLLQSHSVSAQESDQQSSGYVQAQANLAAAQANVARLEQLEGFKKVVAPFNGVITKRNVDPGALINAGSSTPGRELFDLAQVDPLRVYTSVPQSYSQFLKVGAKATLSLQEFPGQTFTGTVARTAEAIDPATRTMLTEVDLPNPDGRLLPGSFGQVHFAVAAGVARLTIPVNTMLFRKAGAQVAVVGPGGKVALRPITIGRDYGTTLEILAGIGPDDPIIVNPSDSLEDGQKVNVELKGKEPARPGTPAP